MTDTAVRQVRDLRSSDGPSGVLSGLSVREAYV